MIHPSYRCIKPFIWEVNKSSHMIGEAYNKDMFEGRIISEHEYNSLPEEYKGNFVISKRFTLYSKEGDKFVSNNVLNTSDISWLEIPDDAKPDTTPTTEYGGGTSEGGGASGDYTDDSSHDYGDSTTNTNYSTD